MVFLWAESSEFIIQEQYFIHRIYARNIQNNEQTFWRNTFKIQILIKLKYSDLSQQIVWNEWSKHELSGGGTNLVKGFSQAFYCKRIFLHSKWCFKISWEWPVHTSVVELWGWVFGFVLFYFVFHKCWAYLATLTHDYKCSEPRIWNPNSI